MVVFCELDDEEKAILLFEQEKYFPHLSLYMDPYEAMFNKEDYYDDETTPNLGWSMDLFMDEYDLTIGNDTQTLKPAGGYWSSPNMFSSSLFSFDRLLVLHVQSRCFCALFFPSSSREFLFF